MNHFLLFILVCLSIIAAACSCTNPQNCSSCIGGTCSGCSSSGGCGGCASTSVCYQAQCNMCVQQCQTVNCQQNCVKKSTCERENAVHVVPSQPSSSNNSNSQSSLNENKVDNNLTINLTNVVTNENHINTPVRVDVQNVNNVHYETASTPSVTEQSKSCKTEPCETGGCKDKVCESTCETQKCKEVVRVPVQQPYTVNVPVPQPFPVNVPVPQPYPVRVAVPQPYPVRVAVPQPYPVRVAVPEPYPVRVAVPHPYPVRVTVPQPYPVREPVPVPMQTPTQQCCMVVQPCVHQGCQSYSQECGSHCLSRMVFRPVNPCMDGGCHRREHFNQYSCAHGHCGYVRQDCSNCHAENFYQSYEKYGNCHGCFYRGPNNYAENSMTSSAFMGNYRHAI